MPAAVAACFVTFYNLTSGLEYDSVKNLRDCFSALGFRWAYQLAISLLGFKSETQFFMKNGRRGFFMSWRKRRMHLALALAMALCASSFVRIVPTMNALGALRT